MKWIKTKRIFAVLALVATIVCGAAAQLRVAVPGVPISVSGTPVAINNNAGAMVISFEEIITGSPATVSIPITGCMHGGTCETLETNTSTSNSIRNPAITKVYDYFQITPSWTGGTNVTFTVNVTLTTAQTRGGGGTWGSITGTLSSQTDLQNALNLLAADSAVVHNSGNETINGQKTFIDPMTVGNLNVTGQLISSGTFDLLSGWPASPCTASGSSQTRICIDTDGSIKQSVNGATPSPFGGLTSFPDGTSSAPGWPATNHPELGLTIVPSAHVLPVTNVQRTSNVITITVDTSSYAGSGHLLNWPVGATIHISGIPTPFTSFNGDCTTTAVTTTTFSCNQSGADVASSATTGNTQIYSVLLAGYEIAMTRFVSTSANASGWGSIRFGKTDPITRAANSNVNTTLVLLRGLAGSDRAQVGDTTGVYFPGTLRGAAADDLNDEAATDWACGVGATSHQFYCHYGVSQANALPAATQVGETVTSVNHAASPYSITAAGIFRCDASGGAVTLNLPAATATLIEVQVKKVDSSANACTVARAGSDTIDGATSVVLSTQYGETRLQDAASATWDRMHQAQLGGALTGIPANAALATVNSGPGTCGDGTHVCQVTTNAGGQVISQSAVAITAGGFTSSSTVGQGGIWSDGGRETSRYNAQTNVAPTIGTMYVHQLNLSYAQPVGHITFDSTNTGAVAETMVVCIYDSTAASLLISGTVSQPAAAGAFSMSVTQTTIGPGTYYVGYEPTGTTAGSLATYTNGGNGTINNVNKQAVRIGTAANTASGTTCPSSLGTLSASTGQANGAAIWLEP